MKTLSASSGIGRKRDRYLVDALVRAVAAQGGKLTPEACEMAVNEAWERPMSKESSTDIIARKLKNPNIRTALAAIYEELGDFTIEAAIKKHVEHIQGVEHDVVTKAGDVVRVQDKPSYPALKDFLSMTLPMPAKKVEVGMTVAGLGSSILNTVPPVAARALGPATVEETPDAQTVEFRDDGEAEEDVDG